MKLFTRCKSCKSEISFLSDVNDRVQLEMKKGKEFPMTCSSCHKKEKSHVNEFTAEKSFTQKITAILIAAVIVVGIILAEFHVLSLGVIFYGVVFLAPSIAYLIINKQQQTQLNSFNRYKVKE